MTIKTLISTIKSNPDGVTINPLTYRPAMIRSGYAVSLSDNTFKVVSHAAALAVARDCRLQARRLHLKRWYIGHWLDRDRRVHCIDLSIIVQSLQAARVIGRTFNQRAIFSFKTMQSINI